MSFGRILAIFDRPGECKDGTDGFPLSEFCAQLAEENDTIQKFLDADFGSLSHYDVVNCLIDLGFAVGYVFGRNFEIVDEDGLKAVQELKEKLVERRALPYFPLNWRKEEPQTTAE